MREAYVIGVGMTPFGKFPDKSILALGRECGVGQSILWELGISGIPISSVGNFCASGSTAFRDAWLAVASGLYDLVLAIGVEQLTARATKGKPLTSDGVELLTAMGFSPPTFFAQMAMRHMYDFGTTHEQLAMVAVKNRKNACYNP